MKEHFKCNCAICCMELLLSVALRESPGTERFLKLASNSPTLITFTSASELIHHLHDQKDGDYRPPSVSEVLGALIQVGSMANDPEISQSVLVLAFMPAIHRTYRETCAWYQEIPTDDIAQQILLFFLQLATSAPIAVLNGQLSFALARSLRRNTLRWARREQAILMDRQRLTEEPTKQAEKREDARFESVSLLRDFLDYCVRVGILSKFERDLLIKVKLDGFIAKEVLDRHTVLSPKAVHLRVQRIMKKLQDAAWDFPSSNGCPSIPLKSDNPEKIKNLSKSMSTFSLSTSTDFLAIGNSRRQLSPESSPSRRITKTQQFSTKLIGTC